MRAILNLIVAERIKGNRLMFVWGVLALGLFLTNVIVGNAQERTRKSEIANPAKFERLSVKTPVQTCTGEITSCAKRVVGDHGLEHIDVRDCGAECPEVREEAFFFNSGVAIFMRTISRLPDDSVDAVRYRVAFKKVQGGYRFVQLGRQKKCSRGPNRGNWTTKACL